MRLYKGYLDWMRAEGYEVHETDDGAGLPKGVAEMNRRDKVTESKYKYPIIALLGTAILSSAVLYLGLTNTLNINLVQWLAFLCGILIVLCAVGGVVFYVVARLTGKW